MIGNLTRSIPELITPAEAVSLSLQYGTSQEALIVHDIAKEWDKRSETKLKHHIDRYYWLLATCYSAGRIQGIREERSRRKQKALTLQD